MEAHRARDAEVHHLATCQAQREGVARLVGEVAKGHANEAVMKQQADHALTKEMEAERHMRELREEYRVQDEAMERLRDRVKQLEADEP